MFVCFRMIFFHYRPFNIVCYICIFLMTIYISTTQYFCCVACGLNRFCDFQTVFLKLLQEDRNISLFDRWHRFQFLLHILNFGFGTDSGENNYCLLHSYTRIQWFWVEATIYYVLLLLTIYCSCSCN